MGSPYSFANMFRDNEEEDPYNLTRGMKNPLTRNLYGGDMNLPSSESAWAEGDIGREAGDLLPPSRDMLAPPPSIEQEDPAAKMYLEHARQPMPSEAIYGDYLSRRPDESGENKPKWYERLIGGLSMLGGGHSAAAGQDFLHRRFNRAYSDWAGEGRMLAPYAKGADLSRQKELEAERFNIIGTAKKKQQEETERKNAVTEEIRGKAAEGKEAKEAEAAKKKEESDKRAEEGRIRAEGVASRAERREQRLEEVEKRKVEKEVDTSRHSSYNRRKKDLEKSLDTIDDDVSAEFETKYKDYFTADDKGNMVPTKEGLEAGIAQMRDAEVKKRKRKLEDDFWDSLESSGITQRLGE